MERQNRPVSRRFVLAAGAAATAGAVAGAGCASAPRAGSAMATPAAPPAPRRARFRSPNEKLAVGAIGAGGKGASDIGGLASEEVVALCDVDWKTAARTFERFPQARKYRDFREMLDKEKLDAVTISTSDHTHAIAALWAMERGIHVYVQKPLTHNVHEARLLREAARRYGVATQMGNQGHSGPGVRQLCEMIWSGAIGAVREVHAWTDRPIWPQGIAGALAAEPVPEHVDWDLWLGPAAPRPYSGGYTPFKWRGWFDFGCGALGDMACHILDPANWALGLRDPISVECVEQQGRTPDNFPKKSIVRFQFGARGAMPPVTVTWYEGGLLPPRPPGIPEEQRLGDGKNGSLFVGESGAITVGTYGDKPRLLPDERMTDYKLPEPLLTRSPGHYRDFIRACKGGDPACASFEYACPFTEWVLLGTIAQRLEGKLTWDAASGAFTGRPEANQYLTRAYRKGWELPALRG